PSRSVRQESFVARAKRYCVPAVVCDVSITNATSVQRLEGSESAELSDANHRPLLHVLAVAQSASLLLVLSVALAMSACELVVASSVTPAGRCKSYFSAAG